MNKLQKSVILLVFEILKIRNVRFVGNFILNICGIILMMWFICVLFSPPVIYHNSQVINSITTREKNE